MTRFRAFLLCAFFLAAAFPLLSAQQVSSTTSNAKPTMSNDDVIALAGAGLGDDIVIAKIHAASSTSFDTSVSGLRALKAAGLSTAVIKAVIDPAEAASVRSGVSSAAPTDPDDPQSPHSPGIYASVTGADGKDQLKKLAYVYAKEVKMTQVVLGFKYTAQIEGAHASLELANANPTFYAYFGQDEATAAVEVRDLSLIQYKVKKKDREAVIGRAKITGAKPGTDKGATEDFTRTEIKPGVYKISLTKPLPIGEFAFYQAGTFQQGGIEQDGGSYFEFGVQTVNP